VAEKTVGNMTEHELIKSLSGKYPSILRWIEAPGTTSIHLNGHIASSIDVLRELADIAASRQGRDFRVEFSFFIEKENKNDTKSSSQAPRSKTSQ